MQFGLRAIPPEKVTEVYDALHLTEAGNLADLYLLERYMPEVVAAYKPKAEFSEFLLKAIRGLRSSDGCPWFLECQGQGVALCCQVQHENCTDDFNPWASLGGNDLLATIAEHWPQLTPEPISHEFPHFQGRYFRVGPDWFTGMVDIPQNR